MIELVLACVAWRRGWKAWALLPLGAALLYGFVLGASGVKDLGMILAGDVVAMIVLGGMALVGKSPS